MSKNSPVSKPRRRHYRTATAAALLIACSSCGDRKPDGQTAAVVNGEAITQSELQQELALMQLPASDKQAQSAALQAIVARKIVAQEARKQKLDQDPNVVLAQRRSNEMILAQKAVEATAVAAGGAPSGADVMTYMDRHPLLGRDRRIFIFDQVKFPAPATLREINQVKATKTMDQLVSLLAATGKTVERQRTEVESALLPDQTLAGLASTPPGEPFVLVRLPLAIGTVVIGTAPTRLNDKQAADLVRQRIAQDRAKAFVDRWQNNLRKEAKIEYGAGYAPPQGTRPGNPAPR